MYMSTFGVTKFIVIIRFLREKRQSNVNHCVENKFVDCGDTVTVIFHHGVSAELKILSWHNSVDLATDRSSVDKFIG